jgi:hypothetical protein
LRQQDRRVGRLPGLDLRVGRLEAGVAAAGVLVFHPLDEPFEDVRVLRLAEVRLPRCEQPGRRPANDWDRRRSAGERMGFPHLAGRWQRPVNLIEQRPQGRRGGRRLGTGRPAFRETPKHLLGLV